MTTVRELHGFFKSLNLEIAEHRKQIRALQERKQTEINELDIVALELTTRAHNALKDLNEPIDKLISRKKRDLLRLPNVGPLTAAEIIRALEEVKRLYRAV